MDAASVLPVEILRRIVYMSVDDDDDNDDETYRRLEDLTTVYHQWRNVILHDGMLWKNVHVTRRTTNGQISTLLRRSGRCNLSVAITSALDSSHLACAEIAIGQYQRVGRLDIGTDAWPLEITSRLTDASIWPELQYLALSHLHPNEGESVSLELRVNAPQLHSLALYRVDVRNLPTLGESLPNLQNLSIERITSGASLTPFLITFSALRDLKLLVPQDTLSADLPPSFSLPHLRSLEIDALELRADLLEAVVSSKSPKLASLSVRFRNIDLRQSRIELSSPGLTDLRIQYVTVAGALPIPIYFRGVPRALVSLTLTGVTDDIAAMVGPSLRKLELAYTDVDVERLSSALSQCQDVEHLLFTCLRSTSAIVHHPTATAVLPKLTYAMLVQNPNDPPDLEIRRLSLDLIPPTVLELYVVGSSYPSGDDLRSVLEDILVAPVYLSLEVSDGGSFNLKEDVRASRRLITVDSGPNSEYVEILLSQATFHAHIVYLDVELAYAVQILGRNTGSLPLLEDLRIAYFPDSDTPYDTDNAEIALHSLVQSVPSPISCPRFRTLGIHLYDDRAPVRVLLPIELKHALVGLFRSERDVVVTEISLEWVE